MNSLYRTRQMLADLVGFATVSADSNLELIGYAAAHLETHGAKVSIQHDTSGQKANLFATIGPDLDGGVVLSGHTDVVPAAADEWRDDPFVMTERDGRLYGRGTCDMKGFIAAALVMAERYAGADLRRPIHYALTYDEEVGCLGARELMAELGRHPFKPAMVIVGEPTEMRVIEGHKGCYEYTTEFRGRDGHASQPDLGVNAIACATRYMNRLMALAESLRGSAPPDSRFSPPWTTVQVGRIEGGTARNVIAARCALEWEMRPVSRHDAEHVKTAMQDYCARTLLPQMRAVAPEAEIRTTTIGEVEGLEPMPDNEARALVSDLIGANSAELVAFGTEAGLFQALGMDVVVCGPGAIAQAHKPDEFIAVTQLEQCLSMLDRLADRLCR